MTKTIFASKHVEKLPKKEQLISPAIQFAKLTWFLKYFLMCNRP